MENQLRVVAGRTHAAEPPNRGRQPADEAHLAQAAGDELLRMGIPRVNVLLAGREETVQPVLQTLLSNVRQRVATWSPGEAFVLPPIEETGVLVLHEVGALDLQEQIQLLIWSGRAMGNTQVISTTSAALFPRVAAGTFIDTLYYRLNTVYMDVSGMAGNVYRD